MIKLKDILYEIEDFKNFDKSKIRWEIKEDKVSFNLRMYILGYKAPPVSYGGGVGIGVGSYQDKNWFGGLSLSKKTKNQKKGYLIVSYVEVAESQKGFGKELFRKALKELKLRGYKGIASFKGMRELDDVYLWNKIKDFSDEYYDYINV